MWTPIFGRDLTRKIQLDLADINAVSEITNCLVETGQGKSNWRRKIQLDLADINAVSEITNCMVETGQGKSNWTRKIQLDLADINAVSEITNCEQPPELSKLLSDYSLRRLKETITERSAKSKGDDERSRLKRRSCPEMLQ
ncbi:hypothetical protein J6590_070870 [Homalodisca vitripennis]|nr:hypothetical protein J6590_070870 [Homalodisca vitripennis]